MFKSVNATKSKAGCEGLGVLRWGYNFKQGGKDWPHREDAS